MPTYQYRCTACGHDLEVVQSFSDAALTECPACSGRLRKVFGSVGLVFKGSGFYKTDSRSSSGGSNGSRPKESDSGSSSSESSAKSDSSSTSSSSSTSAAA